MNQLLRNPIESAFLFLALVLSATPAATQDGTNSSDSYTPVAAKKTAESVLKEESALKAEFIARHQSLLEERYNLSDNPSDVMMSGGRKAVQKGIRVKLAEGVSWERLAEMTPAEIKQRNLFPMGFRPLPHSKHETGGMVFPQQQIDEISQQEGRDLERFDTEFDLIAADHRASQ